MNRSAAGGFQEPARRKVLKNVFTWVLALGGIILWLAWLRVVD